MSADDDTGDGPTRGDGADSFIAFLKDNLEAIAVAVVMALVIKHFCVEAFKIPTSSMMPTLQGETDNDRGEGDRILVDKFAYLFSDPDRWDVVVFRYPLNHARNFIKRIGGLPGEHLRISEDGDLWVRPGGEEYGRDALRIPQKPRVVREGFYRAVYPPPTSDDVDPDRVAETLRRLWDGYGEPLNRWRLENAGHFEFVGGESAELRTGHKIRETSTPRRWAHDSNSADQVRDVRFAARVRMNPQGTADAAAEPTVSTISLRWRPDDEFLVGMELGSEAEASRAWIRRGTELVASQLLNVRLVPDGTYDVELEYVDGTLRAHVDGRELAALADGRRFSDTESGSRSTEQNFSLRAAGAPLVVEDLRIDRDQHYANDWGVNSEGEQRGIDIPNDSYFMLGDNTRNSSDSRKWRMTTVHLRNGSVIRHERGEDRHLDDDEGPDEGPWKRVVDADGITRLWLEADEVESPTTAAAHFVRRDLLVGRAFLVFWPCWPDFPGRLGFIH